MQENLAITNSGLEVHTTTPLALYILDIRYLDCIHIHVGMKFNMLLYEDLVSGRFFNFYYGF